MIIKHVKVQTIEINKDCQKPIPLDRVYGINKNIGRVGITYQNVNKEC